MSTKDVIINVDLYRHNLVPTLRQFTLIHAYSAANRHYSEPMIYSVHCLMCIYTCIHETMHASTGASILEGCGGVAIPPRFWAGEVVRESQGVVKYY